jgi:hypothetical protein
MEVVVKGGAHKVHFEEQLHQIRCKLDWFWDVPNEVEAV